MQRHSILALALSTIVFVAGCGSGQPATQISAQDVFWSQLEQLCGGAFPGAMIQGNESDSDFATQPMVMHVRECGDDEIRIPFHVGENRSRTWIVTRTESGLRLKHDHRNSDGSEEEITQYGGETRGDGDGEWQDFYADDYTAEMIPYAATNVWTIEVVPGERFVYGLRREGTDRRFRVEFDLTSPVEPPPAPWGY